MRSPAFITVGLNPTLQKTLVFPAVVPDAVNRCPEYRFDVTGKGLNVCRVLTQLGKETIHLTQLGGSFRPTFLELCAADSLVVKWVESNSPIRFCYTVIEKDKQQATELVEEGDPAGQGTEERLLAALDEILSACSASPQLHNAMPQFHNAPPQLHNAPPQFHNALLVSGTKVPGLSGSLIPEMVRRAKACGLFVILDIRGSDLLNSLPFKPDLIKPNLEEFAATFASDKPHGFCNAKENTAALCREIYEKYGCRIILTRGAQSLWYDEAGTLEEYPVETVQAVNPIGSGDAFTAGFASAFLDGASFREALAEGARCGRLNALLLKPGAIYAD